MKKKNVIEKTHPDLFLDKRYEKVRKVCDSRTLVGLARTQEVDDRFFSPFPSPDKYEVSTCTLYLFVFAVFFWLYFNCFGRGITAFL